MEALFADLRRIRQEYDLDEAGVKRKVSQAWYKAICPTGRLCARRLDMMRAEKAWIEDFELMDEGYAMWYSGLPPKSLEADDQGLDVSDHVLSVPSRHCSSPPSSGSSSSSLFEIVPGNPVLGAEFKEWGLARLVKQPQEAISDRDSGSRQVQEVISDRHSSCVTSLSSDSGGGEACSRNCSVAGVSSLMIADWSVEGSGDSSSESGKWKELSTVLGELFQEVQDQEVLLDSMAAGEGEAKTEAEEAGDGIEEGTKQQQEVVAEGSAVVVQDKGAAESEGKEAVVAARKPEAEREAVASTGILDEVLKRLESVEGALQTRHVVVGSHGSAKPRALTLIGLLLAFITGIILFLLSSSGVRRGTVLPT